MSSNRSRVADVLQNLNLLLCYYVFLQVTGLRTFRGKSTIRPPILPVETSNSNFFSYPTVRLVGPEPFLGRVELLYRGMWGTVCSSSLPGYSQQISVWNMKSANIVCRQLGFMDALAAPRCASFGPGDGIIWLDGTSCKGSESSLAECGHRDWGDSICSHGDDVGVVCRPQGKWRKNNNLNNLFF